MNFRHNLGLVGLFFITLTLVIGSVPFNFTHAQPNGLQDSRPNILLIIGDDFGFSDIGSFGS